MSEADYNQSYQTITATTSTFGDIEQNIEIKFLNVQDRQIFDSDIELRVEIVSALGVEEKTLFLNNNYFGELSVLDNNIYTIKVPKDVLLAENELRVRVMDNHFNIAEKSITVISNPQ